MRDFDEWLSKFRASISSYDYYIDFEKVVKNVEEIKVELNILNTLIGSKNIEEDFEKIMTKYPETLQCIPLLLAVTVQCNYSSYRISYNQKKRIGVYLIGTNFYLMSRNKKLMREYFAVETEYTIKDIEYEIVDEPYLGYKVHLCKLSAGWRPLFQRHKTISTFKEVEKFCLKNKSMVSIYDEYGRRYTWKQYFKKVYNHSQRKAEPRKWIYDIDPIFPDNGARLHMASCTEQEAEIYMPFCHREYNENEKLAKERFHVHERIWGDEKSWEDPDYPFDWTEGEFC